MVNARANAGIVLPSIGNSVPVQNPELVVNHFKGRSVSGDNVRSVLGKDRSRPKLTCHRLLKNPRGIEGAA